MTEPPRRFDLHAAGHRLEAAWWGPPAEDAPTLVLLHEGLGSVGLWRGFPARLAAATGCGVFAWSRAGYGRSDGNPPPWPLDYMKIEAADRLAPVLAAAGVGRCVLVGHSDGGTIAACYAGTHDDPRVRGLVLLAPHFLVEDICVTAIAATRERYRSGDLRARLARHHDHVDDAFGGWCGAWLDPGFRAFDILAESAGIRVPALMIQGLADPYGTVAQVAVAERAMAPHLTALTLPGVGHSPHLEAEDATLAAIGAFLKRAGLAAP